MYKAAIQGFFIAIGTCFFLSKLFRRLILYPFIPVWWIALNHREDVLLTYHANKFFEDIIISDNYVLGKEKKRVEEICKTFYGKD